MALSSSATQVSASAARYAAIQGRSCDVSGACFPSPDGDSGTLVVEIQRSVRDVDENRRRNFVHQFGFHPSTGQWTRHGLGRPHELPAECSFSGPSPSGNRAVRVVKAKPPGGGGEAVTCVEVWERDSLLARVSAAGVHEGVSSGQSGLGGLSWSRDETKIVYVAERPKPKTAASFFKPLDMAEDGGGRRDEDAATAGWGQQYDLRDDWGEWGG